MSLSPTTKRDIFRQESENTDVVLITITHPSWSEAVRLTTYEGGKYEYDKTNEKWVDTGKPLKVDKETATPLFGFVSRKKTYWYCPIQATLPNSTDEQTPEGRFVLSNVTRELSKYLKMVDREYPKISIEVVNSGAPDTVDMSFPDLDLETAQWNADTVEVTIKCDIAANEPSPWLRFSLAYFPNLVE